MSMPDDPRDDPDWNRELDYDYDDDHDDVWDDCDCPQCNPGDPHWDDLDDDPYQGFEYPEDY